MKKELIIFDFFGVLVTDPFSVWVKKYSLEKESDVIVKDILKKADMGIISADEMFERLGEKVNKDGKTTLNEWLEAINIDAEVIEYIKKLNKRYKTILLSNASKDFIKRILEKIDTEELFEELIISSEEGVAKPDYAIFLRALYKTKVSAENAIFIDDNISNVNASIDAGIDAIQFENLEQLKEEFKKYDVIV